ncbi:endo alpha-1,4 polygalactosaminidase [Chloroflexota bacterium]
MLDEESTQAQSGTRDYRQTMRDFVTGISEYAKDRDDDFIIVPQNGHDLLTVDGNKNGQPAWDYIKAIDGVGREDTFYGYEGDNIATPISARDSILPFMDIAERNGIEVLAIDYCSKQEYMDDSYYQNAQKDYISFAADRRNLDNIPDYPSKPYNENSKDVHTLSEAENFLYLLNPGSYSSKEYFIDALKDTNYDILIIDACFEDILTEIDTATLKIKVNGGSRLVIAYMSIGEAEDYRYYWQAEWENDLPLWLAEENPNWEGNHKVEYWDPGWKEIIYGNNSSYLKRILDAGFDGVYLDIIDAFEYFE